MRHDSGGVRPARSVIALILTHNHLIGLRFAVAEFGLMVVLVAPFGLYLAIRGRWLLALIALGIVSNCAVVLVYAVRSLIRGEADVGIRALYTDPATRREGARDHPNVVGEIFLPGHRFLLASRADHLDRLGTGETAALALARASGQVGGAQGNGCPGLSSGDGRHLRGRVRGMVGRWF